MSIKTERDNWKEKASKAQHQAMFFLKERERMKKIAVAAVLACPGSFVLGGMLLQTVLEWWRG